MNIIRSLTLSLLLISVLSCTNDNDTDPLAPGTVIRENDANPGCKVGSISHRQTYETINSNNEITDSRTTHWDFEYEYDELGLISESNESISVEGTQPSTQQKAIIRNDLGMIESVRFHSSRGIEIKTFERDGNSITIKSFDVTGQMVSRTVFEVVQGYINKRTIYIVQGDGSENIILESEYTWVSDNLTQRITHVYDVSDGSKQSVVTFNFEYDDKNNPEAYLWSEHHFQQSKNNVLKIHSETVNQYNHIEKYTLEYSYTYNSDNYPTTSTIDSEQSAGDLTYIFHAERSYTYHSCN